MGYYTNFSIEIKTAITIEKAKEIVEKINSFVFYGEISKKVDEDKWFFYIEDYIPIDDNEKTTWDIMSSGELKWYDWEKDMKEIAKTYPNIEFKVEGNGEDRDDWWIALLKGDRYQFRECTPPLGEWEE